MTASRLVMVRLTGIALKLHQPTHNSYKGSKVKHRGIPTRKGLHFAVERADDSDADKFRH
ncbi:Hypothetical protein PMT_2486 [Prochlorococcus marinus str. MIT 9313]|uniref:Uncharacterized protein n=1 Tax=Prochlorococcus marinus (strain MIT 9313) TaxID=74547 RepID=B9ERX7_PROMM|nr:Hypothetical protein PMT_2486 [Prochlorococcus marinus str. MIT 9313]